MKISKKDVMQTPTEESVYVMLDVPEDLHRLIKSEAALRKVKLNVIVLEALTKWQKEKR